MVAERIRAFLGSTELNTSNIVLIKSNDHIVNTGKITIEKNTSAVVGSVIDLKRKDGSTSYFSAKIVDKKEELMWELDIKTNGYELMNIQVEQVYENTSPEDIVADVINNHTTNLTFASSNTSGFTRSKYIANGYAIDVIKDQMDLLDWQLRIDVNDNVYFEPKGNTNPGITFTNGSDFTLTFWKEDATSMFNRAKVIGGYISRFTQNTGTGDGSTVTFDLDQKPVGVVKVIDDGTIVTPTVDDSPYSVDPDNQQITFTTAPVNNNALTFDYEFKLPVTVDYQNDDSILQYDEIFQKVPAPFLDTFADARKYAQNLVDVKSTPDIKAKGYEPFINFEREVGDLITVVDTVGGRTKSELLVITKITLNAQQNKTWYDLGPRDFELFDWQRKVEDRIKKIERITQDEESPVFARTFKHKINTTLTVRNRILYNNPMNSFVLSNPTLSFLRSSRNREADCSNNSNYGTWGGSSIGGDQFTSDGWRLFSGTFNGSDNKITVSDSSELRLTGNLTIALAVKVSSLPGAQKWLLSKYDGTDGYGIRINSSNKVELFYSDSGAESTIEANTALTANIWQHVVFVKDGTDITVYVEGVEDKVGSGGSTIGSNTTDLLIGNYSTTFFSGNLDEVRVYDEKLVADTVLSLYNKSDVTTNLKGYWSMDDPILNDSFLPKIEWVSSTSFRLFFRETDIKHGDSSAYLDTTHERVRMSQSTDQSRAYTTMFKTVQFFVGGRNLSTITLTPTQTLFGNDIVKLYISANGESNWEEVTAETSHNITNQGNDLRIMMVFIGNGAYDTFVEDMLVEFTRN